MFKSDDKTKLEDLCIKIAGRVIGNYEEQSKATVHSLEVLIFSSVLSEIFVGHITSTSKLFDTLQLSEPMAFED